MTPWSAGACSSLPLCGLPVVGRVALIAGHSARLAAVSGRTEPRSDTGVGGFVHPADPISLSARDINWDWEIL